MQFNITNDTWSWLFNLLTMLLFDDLNVFTHFIILHCTVCESSNFTAIQINLCYVKYQVNNLRFCIYYSKKYFDKCPCSN